VYKNCLLNRAAVNKKAWNALTIKTTYKVKHMKINIITFLITNNNYFIFVFKFF